MSAKEVKLGVDARDLILRGVQILNKALKETHGPKGRNVVLLRQVVRRAHVSPRTASTCIAKRNRA